MRDQSSYQDSSQFSAFPSKTDLKALRQKFRPSGYESSGSTRNLSEDELWRWHAYDYGFRSIILGDKNTRSPIDPTGQWFDKHLVWSAEGFYRAMVGARSDRTQDSIDERNCRQAEAAEWRQKFAEEHGFRDFGEVMAYGVARAWTRASEE